MSRRDDCRGCDNAQVEAELLQRSRLSGADNYDRQAECVSGCDPTPHQAACE